MARLRRPPEVEVDSDEADARLRRLRRFLMAAEPGSLAAELHGQLLDHLARQPSGDQLEAGLAWLRRRGLLEDFEAHGRHLDHTNPPGGSAA